MIGIYKITSPLGHVYIGKSTNIEKRFNRYRQLYMITQPLLLCSLRKHTPARHTFEIVTICTTNELDFYENFWIQNYKDQQVATMNTRNAKNSCIKICL